MKDDFEIKFTPEERPIIIHLKNLWNDIVFISTILWYMIKGYFIYYGTMGGLEIEVGYEENGKMHYYLQLEKLW